MLRPTARRAGGALRRSLRRDYAHAGMEAPDPIVLSVDLPEAPEAAFWLFASRFADWWPARTHSLSRDAATVCRIQCETGGAVEERSPDGDWHRWGSVEVYEPGRRLRFSWHPGREPESAQWVDVTFAPLDSGSRVTLRHGGWEALGEIAPILRREYAAGWRIVLGQSFAGFVQREH
jgi:activator of Hsp90 ATPase-like protein